MSSVYWPDGPLLGLDLETTGVDPFTDLPVSWGLVYVEGGEVIRTRNGFVNPGRPIPEEATAVHGLTWEMVGGDDSIELAVSKIFNAVLDAIEEGIPLVGMNIPFDLTVLDSCSRRSFCEPAPELCPVIDLAVLDRRVWPDRHGSRSLSALAEHYGVDRGELHEPVSDATAAVMVTRALCERYPWVGHANVRSLHRNQAMWNTQQKQARSFWQVREGNDPVPQHEFGWPYYRRVNPIDAPGDVVNLR